MAVFVSRYVNAATLWTLNVESMTIRAVVCPIVSVLREESTTKARMALRRRGLPHELRGIYLAWLSATRAKVRLDRVEDVSQLRDVVHAHSLVLHLVVLLINLNWLTVDVQGQSCLHLGPCCMASGVVRRHVLRVRLGHLRLRRVAIVKLI